MKRFIEGEDRSQATLFPERLEDYIAEDNAIRVIDAFVDRLDLHALGFERVEPSATGRPGYHPGVILKIYVYGYLNRIQSSRRLERESHRNVELIWLTRRLMPDFKTIADFRKDNRAAIRRVCRQFVELCRELDLFSQTLVAIDGSKFKGVNSRDKNFTRNSVRKRIRQLEGHIEKYLTKLDAADKEEPEIREATAVELKEKIASMEAKLDELNERAKEVEAHPDKQVSLTDPDSRSMLKPGGGSVVGYNVQTAVDSKHHLIPYHEVTNAPSDRGQLSGVAREARAATRGDTDHNELGTGQQFTVVADPGYYKGEEIVECVAAGIRPLVPKVDTSGSRSAGRYSKSDFKYDAQADGYICPAGRRLTYRFDSHESGKRLKVYMVYGCGACPQRSRCTTASEKRLKRWEHEDMLDAVQTDLKRNSDAMRERKKLAEHPYGTIKHWMGSTHFLMKGIENVRAEMSLHVLSYNMKRAIAVLGVPMLLEHLQAA